MDKEEFDKLFISFETFENRRKRLTMEDNKISKEYLEEKGFTEVKHNRTGNKYSKVDEFWINQRSTISITLHGDTANQICLDYNTETGQEDTFMHMYPRISKVSELEELLKMLDINWALT